VTRVASFAVVYDISADRERHRVEHFLQGYGIRVQKSVFECRLTPAQRERLVGGLGSLTLETGFIYVYRLLGDGRPVAIGKAPPPVDADAAFIL